MHSGVSYVSLSDLIVIFLIIRWFFIAFIVIALMLLYVYNSSPEHSRWFHLASIKREDSSVESGHHTPSPPGLHWFCNFSLSSFGLVSQHCAVFLSFVTQAWTGMCSHWPVSNHHHGDTTLNMISCHSGWAKVCGNGWAFLSMWQNLSPQTLSLSEYKNITFSNQLSNVCKR